MNELPSHLEEALLRLVREKLFDGGAPMTVETDLFAAGLDSMGIMQLMISIEERFGVRVPEASVTRENFSTASSLAALVRRGHDPEPVPRQAARAFGRV
jgi:acyl carrier protein